MKACEVNIYGQTYTLHADIDPEEVTRVAEMVDSQMRAVAQASPSASAVQVAVLAALAIASDKGTGSGDADPAIGSGHLHSAIELIVGPAATPGTGIVGMDIALDRGSPEDHWCGEANA